MTKDFLYRKVGMVKFKDISFGNGNVAVIAGPCAVESQKQMDNVADFLKGEGLRFMRGGAFKPRSSPYSFQGLGDKGLEILEAVRERYRLVTVSEVMDTKDVEKMGRKEREKAMQEAETIIKEAKLLLPIFLV